MTEETAVELRKMRVLLQPGIAPSPAVMRAILAALMDAVLETHEPKGLHHAS